MVGINQPISVCPFKPALVRSTIFLPPGPSGSKYFYLVCSVLSPQRNPLRRNLTTCPHGIRLPPLSAPSVLNSLPSWGTKALETRVRFRFVYVRALRVRGLTRVYTRFVPGMSKRARCSVAIRALALVELGDAAGSIYLCTNTVHHAPTKCSILVINITHPLGWIFRAMVLQNKGGMLTRRRWRLSETFPSEMHRSALALSALALSRKSAFSYRNVKIRQL